MNCSFSKIPTTDANAKEEIPCWATTTGGKEERGLDGGMGVNKGARAGYLVPSNPRRKGSRKFQRRLLRPTTSTLKLLGHLV